MIESETIPPLTENARAGMNNKLLELLTNVISTKVSVSNSLDEISNHNLCMNGLAPTAYLE